MERLLISIPKQQKDALEQQSKETGLSMAEIIRRAIDKYLEEK